MIINLPAEVIEKKILLIRGQKVMLDRDLADLYGVETRVLNQAVRRNMKRFPEDFMFALTREEILELITNCDKFQNQACSKCKRLYRAGSCHAVHRSKERQGYRG